MSFNKWNPPEFLRAFLKLFPHPRTPVGVRDTRIAASIFSVLLRILIGDSPDTLHCDSSKIQINHMLWMTLMFVVGVYVSNFGWEVLCGVSSGRCERCVITLLEEGRSSASAKGRNWWCWEELIRTGSAVVRETKRGWYLSATPPSSCDLSAITAALHQ